MNIGPLAKWILGDLPGLDRVSLNWTVLATGQDAATADPSGGWCVIASDPRHLAAVAQALAAAPDAVGEAAWANCGAVNGHRLARQLGTWRNQAGLLAATPDVEALAETLELMAELAHGVNRCWWRLRRPSAQRVRLEAEVELSPPDSSGSDTK